MATLQESKQTRQYAYTLHERGANNKEIARTIEKSEQTVCRWVKAYKKAKSECLARENKYFEKIDNLLNTPTATVAEIRRAVDSLYKLQDMHKARLLNL